MENQEKEVNPLRRWHIPRESKTSQGTIVFRTLDDTMYVRLENSSIRRVHPKVNGKVARKLRASARRKG